MIAEKPKVDPQGWYTTSQAARALHVGRHTINRYAQNGWIRFKIRRSDLRKVCKGGEILQCWGEIL
jgi:predicted site-specific integrase-resolvase